MVRIYVNGKQVTKEELSNYEIHNKAVKRILSEKLTKNKRYFRIDLDRILVNSFLLKGELT